MRAKKRGGTVGAWPRSHMMYGMPPPTYLRGVGGIPMGGEGIPGSVDPPRTPQLGTGISIAGCATMTNSPHVCLFGAKSFQKRGNDGPTRRPAKDRNLGARLKDMCQCSSDSESPCSCMVLIPSGGGGMGGTVSSPPSLCLVSLGTVLQKNLVG